MTCLTSPAKITILHLSISTPIGTTKISRDDFTALVMHDQRGNGGALEQIRTADHPLEEFAYATPYELAALLK